MEERPMNNTFEEWLEKLKELNPNLDWKLMSNSVIADLKDTYEEEKKCSQ